MHRIFALIVILVFGAPDGAKAAEDLTATARAALSAFVKGTMAGSKVLAPMLAPEFQIMRTNGVGYSRKDYLSRGVPTISAAPEFSLDDVTATRNGDILVVRYFLRIDETIQGKPVKKRAPRLTVFRNVAGSWKVVAHSNFGATR